MTFSRDEIEEWYDKFDSLIYPTRIYDELVWCNKDNIKKIELLGAWKTGCIRINNNAKNPVYVDEIDTKYEYTERWKASTPVGFSIWMNLSDNINSIYKDIPPVFQDNEPKVLMKIREKRGFGFIWGIFVLHCLYPKVYPLYDQHVYRAYKYILNPNIDLPNVAQNSWSEYHKYTNFFKKLVLKENCSQVKVDRALWAYGKYLKIMRSSKNTKKNQNIAIKNYDGYCLAFTLGGKHKRFWWKINKDCSLEIIRKFDSGNGKITLETFSEKEIENIQQFINNTKIPLANNVQKIKDGTEKKGLGKFLYEKLDRNTTQAQLASHISTVFYKSGIWGYNRKKQNMLFWKLSNDWKNLLNAYYIEQREQVEGNE